MALLYGKCLTFSTECSEVIVINDIGVIMNIVS